MPKIKSILIVEDERPIARALELKLKNSGFAAEPVNNGEEALLILGVKKFDLIILDLVMPKMDGFTFLTEIRKRGIDTPVIVTSNLSQDEDKARAKKLGAVDYLIKSNTPLTAIVEKIKIISEGGSGAHHPCPPDRQAQPLLSKEGGENNNKIKFKVKEI
jgi:DNA-binding response OmpR family regulator